MKKHVKGFEGGTGRKVRVWIISHGTPHIAASFQPTPGKKILVLFSSTCTRHPLNFDEYVLPCENM